MQVRDLIEELKRFEPHEEVRVEVKMEADPAFGRMGPWTMNLKVDGCRKDRMIPVIETK